MSSLNPISFNALGVGGSTPSPKKEVKKEEVKEEIKQAPAKEQMDPAKVLELMAGVAGLNKASVIDPSKYVDAASKERIAKFMGEFEETVARNLDAISKEFPKMSEDSKTTMALKMTEEKI